MKRSIIAASASLVLLCFLPAPGGAQGATPTMTLAFQTPWNTPKRSTLDVKVLVRNDSPDTLAGISLQATIWSAIPNRSTYELSLTQDEGTPVAPSKVARFKDLPAGSAQTLHIRTDVGFLEQQSPEPRIYPLTVTLDSAGAAVAEIRSSVIFLPKKPKVPLQMAWTFVAGQPFDMRPDGTFQSRLLERRIAPGGTLRGELMALDQLIGGKTSVPVDFAVSPSLVMQLQQMRSDYRVSSGTPNPNAGAWAATSLDLIRDAAQSPAVEVSALPLSSPDLPQLLASGLGKDLGPQLQLGRSVVQSVTGISPVAQVLRPPGSDVDDQSLSRLRTQGVKVVLLDEGSASQPPQPKGFAPPATASFLTGGQSAIGAIVPDPGVQAIMQSSVTRDDPSLSAQWILGDLAAIWLEQPDQERSVATLISTEMELPPDFLETFAHDVENAPWLRTRSATEITSRFPADAGAAKLRASKPSPIPHDYLAQIQQSGSIVDTYRSILANPASTPLPAELSRDLLIAEGGPLVSSPSLGGAWISWVRQKVAAEFSALTPQPAQVVTLTSRHGEIPVSVPNGTGQQVHVFVRLISSRLQFTGQNPLPVTPPKTLTFSVATRTTGTFPVQVVVEAPGGRPIAQSTLVVRSTAYSRIALYMTLGAVGVLVALWIRRLFWKRT